MHTALDAVVHYVPTSNLYVSAIIVNKTQVLLILIIWDDFGFFGRYLGTPLHHDPCFVQEARHTRGYTAAHIVCQDKTITLPIVTILIFLYYICKTLNTTWGPRRKKPAATRQLNALWNSFLHRTVYRAVFIFLLNRADVNS